jgi:hypothetical protein
MCVIVAFRNSFITALAAFDKNQQKLKKFFMEQVKKQKKLKVKNVKTISGSTESTDLIF